MTSVLLPVNVLSLGQQYKDYAKENPSKPKRGRRVKKKEALKTKYMKPPVSKPKFSNIEVPVGKPKKTRDVQKLKDSVIKAVKSQDQTTTYKRAVPGKPGSQVYLVPPKGKK